jgi:hypothetical protein
MNKVAADTASEQARHEAVGCGCMTITTFQAVAAVTMPHGLRSVL